MKKFIKKLMIWILPLLLLFGVLGSFADGNTDDNYLQFTRQGNNIIMGDSRGAQAIVSDTLEKHFLGRAFDNFALNITYSPYGEIYLKGLKRKLKKNTKDGIFILTVDPWSVSMDKNATGFSEEPSPLNDMILYNIKPNYEYLIRHYHQSWFYIYRDRAAQGKSATFLHDNGWLEVSVDMNPAELAKRVKEKVEFYKGFAKGQALSPIRLKYFQETIQYLNHFGKVYIVRLPGGPEINEIEKNYAPDFNPLMKQIARKNNAVYFDFTPQVNNYTFTDGNHMYKESSKVLTRQIVDSIKSSQQLK